MERCIPPRAAAGYRNRAKLAVGEIDGHVRVGLFERGTNRIVDLAPCRVQRDVVQASIEPVRAWLSEHGLARPRGPVIYVDVREALSGDTPACHVTLVVDARRLAGAKKSALPIESLLARMPGVVGVAVNYGDASSSYAAGQATEPLVGDGTFMAAAYPRADGLAAFAVPAAGFFQVSPSALEDIHQRMLDHLGEDGPVLDLYCGVGVHGLMIAAAGRGGSAVTLTGIDDAEASIECARKNADRFGIVSRMIAAPVQDYLPRHAVQLIGADTRVILNPGRAGCRTPVLDAIAGRQPRRAAYLSCNPATLARDLDHLVRAGMPVRCLVPIDLMPQTDLVETLALLGTRDVEAGLPS